MNIIQPVEDPVNRVRGERKDVRSCETETLEIINVASGHKVLKIVVIEKLQVPTRPACTSCDKGGTTTISVYRKAASDKRSNGNLYVGTESLGWLLAYAADELHFQGAFRTKPEPSDKQTGNCTAAAGATAAERRCACVRTPLHLWGGGCCAARARAFAGWWPQAGAEASPSGNNRRLPMHGRIAAWPHCGGREAKQRGVNPKYTGTVMMRRR